MVEEKHLYKIEAVINNGVYQSEVSEDILNLMLQANIVTICGTSVSVQEIEVTDNGVVKFHGDIADIWINLYK